MKKVISMQPEAWASLALYAKTRSVALYESANHAMRGDLGPSAVSKIQARLGEAGALKEFHRSVVRDAGCRDLYDEAVTQIHEINGEDRGHG